MATARQWQQQPLEFSAPITAQPSVVSVPGTAPEAIPAYDLPLGVPLDDPNLVGSAQKEFDEPLICLECVANVIKKFMEIVVLGIVITIAVFVVIGLGIELGVFAAIGTAISATTM